MNNISQRLQGFFDNKENRTVFYWLVIIWNVLLFCLMIAAGPGLLSKNNKLELYTGTEGGLYASQGKELFSFLSEQADMEVNAYYSDGDVENYQRLNGDPVRL